MTGTSSECSKLHHQKRYKALSLCQITTKPGLWAPSWYSNLSHFTTTANLQRVNTVVEKIKLITSQGSLVEFRYTIFARYCSLFPKRRPYWIALTAWKYGLMEKWIRRSVSPPIPSRFYSSANRNISPADCAIIANFAHVTWETHCEKLLTIESVLLPYVPNSRKRRRVATILWMISTAYIKLCWLSDIPGPKGSHVKEEKSMKNNNKNREEKRRCRRGAK